MKDDIEVVGFEVLIAVALKSFISWDIMLYSLVKVNQHLRGKYCLLLEAGSKQQITCRRTQEDVG
jgi:hypothetical protein